MEQLSFKNRIAFNYIVTTALLIFVVFFIIYSIVKFSVYSHVNTDITSEVKKHIDEIKIEGNTFYLIHREEWKEREHNTLDVNPVFIQFTDSNGKVIEKSPNLKRSSLAFKPDQAENNLFDTKLANSAIRQIQVPIYEKTKIIGYIIIAMSLEDATMVLNNLAEVLIIAFPIILILLFIIARFIAGRFIKPISSIITTSNIITTDNLTSRILLPPNKDELYVLSQTINNLLDRIETAIKREKQFTSDASHELRTPLTVIKGTLEVLIRKPRDHAQYEEKINFCVKEVNRLNHLVDQLLLLARFENQKQTIKTEKVYLNALFLDTIARHSSAIKVKKIGVSNDFSKDFYFETDLYLFSIVINNLISNAVKYSNENGSLTIEIKESNSKIECHIIDSGIGIPQEDLERIYNPFYRSKSSDHPEIKGTGLGLSIVNRLCSLLAIEIVINSQESKGTSVILSLCESQIK
ncbi:Signal transduction histidine kinase [Flavobacterium micromati]|uniref:histidine kinase n=1 Tax=Flavobacterium micromati TaxID=229205 RepID=A0A1M5J8R2_9FLAO|nr:HAMP domain-containing sensor histidine kinase [Flavobacterium micromati]SHG36968.1 Signal transduction histidine kinase [Flavobacterium micromati]